MHIAIDIVAAIILLFFFFAGWHQGFLLSLLGVVRVVLAYGAAYFSGRYIGFWLGEIAHRPRIVTIPAVAGLTFVFITFFFHVMMTNIRQRHREKEEEEDYRHSLLSSLGGGAINLTGGVLSLVLIFWLADLFMVGTTGTAIPGADKALFSRFTRRTIYEVALRIIPTRDYPSQVASISHMISNPADAMEILEQVVDAESIQRLATDKQLAADILSGDAERIGQNPSFEQLCSDRRTLENLRDLGLLSGNETRSGLCDRLAALGKNPRVRMNLESLNERDMLHPDKLLLLMRDPAFDAIVAELIR